jgi:hypothetical protein
VIVGLAFLLNSCASQRAPSREILADPILRFSSSQTVADSYTDELPPVEPIEQNTFSLKTDIVVDPAPQSKQSRIYGLTRLAAEIYAGIGLEAGYGLSIENQTVQKLDGFLGPLEIERKFHGPEAAIVVDDGHSVLRLGYRYRTAWDEELHEPSISARTTVLGQDTVVELGYRRTMSSIFIDGKHLPAMEPIDQNTDWDHFNLALEQGWLPGYNLRLDLNLSVAQGFLQSPYRLVSLWSQRGVLGETFTLGLPRSMAENHPDKRVQYGGQLRLRRLIQAWSSVIELGAAYGSGSWRVEHSQISLSYIQRIADSFSLRLSSDAYHQTRASFYRDDYNLGPVGAYWSADRNLSSYIAIRAESELSWLYIPSRGRAWGMFKYINLLAGIRFCRAYYHWEGVSSNNGFSSYPSLATISDKQIFDGGTIWGGWLGMEGGF